MKLTDGRRIISVLRQIATMDEALTVRELRADCPAGQTLQDLLDDINHGDCVIYWGCFSNTQLATVVSC